MAVVREPPLQGAQLLAELLAQLGVEIGERLVEKEHLRLDDERAGERHALLLAAGELARVAAAERGEVDERQRRRDAAPDRRARARPPHAQPEADIARRPSYAGRGHRTGRPGRRSAAPGRGRRRGLSPMWISPLSGSVMPAIMRISRGLAAARRAEQGDELALGDVEVETIDRDRLAERLAETVEADAGHARSRDGNWEAVEKRPPPSKYLPTRGTRKSAALQDLADEARARRVGDGADDARAGPARCTGPAGRDGRPPQARAPW